MCDSKQNGNVIFFILIAIALFAALSMAVNQAGQGNGGEITEEKSRVYASEIMEYGDLLSATLSKLRLSGCSLEQISFERTGSTDYANGTAPVDNTCDVFSNEGGGLTWPDFSPAAFDPAWSSHADFGDPIFSIKNEIPQVGTDGDGANSFDLVMFVEGLAAGVCSAINQRIDGSTLPDSADEMETKYDGVVNTTGTYTFPAAFNGKRQGCYQDSAGGDAGTRTYYYVVSIR